MPKGLQGFQKGHKCFVKFYPKGVHYSKKTEFKKGQKHSKNWYKKMIGRIPWNYKGGKPKCKKCGKKLSTYKSKLCSVCVLGVYHDEKNGNWKGDKVGYYALHTWVIRKLGNPKLCDFCGTTTAKRYEWANKSGKYLRDINDYIRLCKKCHNNLDGVNIQQNIKKRLKK